jgi:hypothetical protein
MTSNLKFGLNYKLVYQTKDKNGNLTGEVEIPIVENQLGLTCEFEIKRSLNAELNTSIFKIRNLSLETREKMFKDRYDTLGYSRMWFYLGYGDQLDLAFTGNILATSSYNANNTDIITQIEAQDGSFLTYNTNSNFSVNENTTYEDVYNRIINDLKKKAEILQDDFKIELLSNNAKTELSKRTPTKMTFAGNSWNILKKYYANVFFIDNNTLFYLLPDDKKNKSVFLINAATGLLEVPKVSNVVLIVKTICEPSIQVGDLVEIETTKSTSYTKKQFKVFGINHAGTIGRNVLSKVITTLELNKYNIDF